MMFYFKVAWRNLWRNKRRTLITSSAMALSVSMCMAIMCLTDGMYGQLNDVMVTQQMGHVQIHHPEYPRTKSMYDSLSNVDSLNTKIKSVGELKASSERLYGNFLAGGEKKSAGAQVIGFRPDAEKTLTRIASQVIEGDFLMSTDELVKKQSKEGSEYFIDPDPMFYPEFDGPIIIGKDLAKDLTLPIGSKLILFGMNAEGETIEGIFKVIGIYKTGSLQKDRGAMTHLSSLQRLMGLKDQAHELIVISKNGETEEEVEGFKSEIATALGLEKEDDKTAVKSWMETSPQTAEMMKMRDVTMAILLGLIFFIAAFGILNTMLMSVFERTRELGVLKALGLRPIRLVNMVLVEALVLSLIAAVSGLILGGVLDWLLIEYGLNFETKPGEGFTFNGAVMDPVMKGKFLIESAVMPAIGLIVVSVLSAIWPAIRAARLQPVDAIKQD